MLTTIDAWITWRDAITTALQAQPNLDVLVNGVDFADEPNYRLDPDGGVHMTAVLWMGIGAPVTSDDQLCGPNDLGQLTWQVTAVAGDVATAARAALKVRAALSGQHLVPPHGRALEQADAANVRPDRSATPTRFIVPMPYSAQLA